jgi:hypothetical protein
MPSLNLWNGPSEARSKKDFFGAGGVIDSFPLSTSETFAIVECCEICSLSHAGGPPTSWSPEHVELDPKFISKHKIS